MGASLQLDRVSCDSLASRDASWWDDVLGVVGFDNLPHMLPPPVPVPMTASLTRELGTQSNRCEVWRIAGDHGTTLRSSSFEQGRLHYRHGDGLLFGCLMVSEDSTDAEASNALRRATMDAYEQMFALLSETRHPHLIRIWNYLPDINGILDGEERYRRFNTARQTAFRNSGRSTVGTVPAASALGSPAGNPLSIYFLASTEPPTMIENPRQTSAYFYPAKFGAHSPTFSRACVLRQSAGTSLFVSGTASIVGHETVHLNDVEAQTHESLANIDALVHEANRIADTQRYVLDQLQFKVYVRRASDLDVIANALTTLLKPSTSIVYLQADVCREELLVEIEATGAAVSPARAEISLLTGTEA